VFVKESLKYPPYKIMKYPPIIHTLKKKIINTHPKKFSNKNKNKKPKVQPFFFLKIKYLPYMGHHP
jgi:hypothetical protein